MIDVLINIDSIIFIASIFLLAFFCAIKPNANIARWLYLIFGLSILPILPGLMEGMDKWLIVWPLLFSLSGILMFISISLSLKNKPEEEINKKLQEASIKGGKRRIVKNISKGIK